MTKIENKDIIKWAIRKFCSGFFRFNLPQNQKSWVGRNMYNRHSKIPIGDENIYG
jgi:hypothetical protein